MSENEMILASLDGDGKAVVTIDGKEHPVSATDDDTARREALEIVKSHAEEINATVSVRTVDGDGESVLYMSPKGSVSTEPPPAATRAEAKAVPKPEPIPEDVKPLPTVSDFLASRPPVPEGPAEESWRGALRRGTGGLIKLAPGKLEIRHREAVGNVQRSFSGPRTVVILNPKGGAWKTTATLNLAEAFGTLRGGSTLAWDNNETRGTLGWRASEARHSNTAVDLLRDKDKFTDPTMSRVGDLDFYVRSQGNAQFDVLASDEDAASAASIDAAAFDELHKLLSRFYRVMIVDTGNNMRASNWQAAVAAADQLVIVSTVREDTAASAAWLVDGLRAMGHGDKVKEAVTLLGAPAANAEAQLLRRLRGHFGSLTREVLEIPHDPALVQGGRIPFDALSAKSKEAWLFAAEAIANGL